MMWQTWSSVYRYNTANRTSTRDLSLIPRVVDKHTTIVWCTPIDKSNGRFFSDAKINMMPSSNLHDFWWVYWMHVRVHFPCQIYWLFVLTPYPRGSKDGECSFFLNQVWIIVNFMRWHLADSDEIVHTSNLRRFLNLTQMSWRLAALLQNHERMNACHCVSSSVSLCMLI